MEVVEVNLGDGEYWFADSDAIRSPIPIQSDHRFR